MLIKNKTLPVVSANGKYIAQGFAIVYIYARGFEAETIRSHGYAPIGAPCIDSYNWQGKKRTNVIGALYEKMLFALDYFERNINGDIFYQWCKNTLINTMPQNEMRNRHG